MLLQIPNPCHENWVEMSPEMQGRFCQSCQKTVIDFTDMTDNQVARFFKENENICGRFNALQINRPLSETIEIKRLNRHPAWKYMIWSALAVSSLMSGNDVYAQGSPIKTHTDNSQYTLGEPISLPNHITLKGVIFDASSEKEMANAIISVKASSVSATSDANGYFEITLPKNQGEEKIELIIKAQGYRLQKRVISSKQFGDIIIINMQKEAKEPVPVPIPVKPPVLMGKVDPHYYDKQ